MSPPPLPDEIAEFLGDPRDPETMKRRVAEVLQKHNHLLRDLQLRAQEDRAASEERIAALEDEYARLRVELQLDSRGEVTSPGVHLSPVKDRIRRPQPKIPSILTRVPPSSGVRVRGRWVWIPD